MKKYILFIFCSLLAVNLLFCAPQKASAASRAAGSVSYSVDNGNGSVTHYTFFIVGKAKEVYLLLSNPASTYQYYFALMGYPSCGNFTISLVAKTTSCTPLYQCSGNAVVERCSGATQQCSYGCSNGSCNPMPPTPPPPPPTNLSGSCSTGGKTANFSWVNAAGYNTVYFRAVDTTLFGCVAQNLSNLWNEGVVGTTYSINTTPGHSYCWWLNTKASDGKWSTEANTKNFTCECDNGTSNPPTCTKCPSGYSLINNVCTLVCSNGATDYPTCTICPIGYNLINNICTPECSNGASNYPTCTICPSGYTLINNACIPPSCTPSYRCNADNTGVINSCNNGTTLCPTDQVCIEGACSSLKINKFNPSPSQVPKNSGCNLVYDISGALSCNITGTNIGGQGINSISLPLISGTISSSTKSGPIQTKTTYTLSCADTAHVIHSKQANCLMMVDIIFNEF
ncbi:MAG: hypothetical protein WCW87_02420 [Candidatus Paceibacterota bacterium]